MFNKILIANRGEIAIRIMATCREMGVGTVAVYSEADRHARHVQAADEAYLIGPAPAAQSYLRIEAIIEAARKSGAEAIHPGYGFLSENAAFVEACDAAGIVFIGPPAAAMRLMGSKIAAKQIAQSVGAPTVPGYNGAQQDDETLFAEARRTGFPLLIKASAGGGGKGMREVHDVRDFLEQLAGARREALNAFGDGTIFLERLIQQPRHVEFQVLGDTYGNLVYLGERECSIQRRHQKIVEESPSVALSPTLRAAMGEAAVRIAKAAGYVNAGTLEFMLDVDQRFYFLEMNTRLQVEHPVTELVTGLDLVRHQIRIAAGEALEMAQEQIQPRGHAIEARLYAEDPEQNFLPSTGAIAAFLPPAGPGVRVDSGIASGDEITQFYDPMVAKLIVYGEDRPAAIARLQAALEQTVTLGVKTNAALLLAIARHSAFQDGLTHTHFLDEYGLIEAEQQRTSQAPDLYAFYAAAFYDILHVSEAARNGAQTGQAVNPWQALGPWRMVGEGRSITYHYGGQAYRGTLSSSPGAAGTWTIQAGNHAAAHIGCIFGSDGLVLMREGSQQRRAYVARVEGQTQVAMHGQTYRFDRRQPPDIDATAHGGNVAHSQKTLTAPMAGTIVKVQARDGQFVQQRQVLVILSAMKMEHTIAAPYEGTVRRVYYGEGDVVKGGAVVVEME
ncbi:MAG TPA: acetyl-CoA carboxylase biotin carboxylase subunit [Ktedonobacteraceae bacterium]|nr:acetyl-CoA carboxylase biotin carboxylase subunit [Ktedonobacteraceae bacterium]